uniref:Secreted protein n=1 Tax=Zea mays TaxID=4577 RepID=C0P914_MAIZE|nr:unknown [Zea mays]ACN31038.1 unknown [Zea mays]
MLRSLLLQLILMSPKFFSQLLHFCLNNVREDVVLSSLSSSLLGSTSESSASISCGTILSSASLFEPSRSSWLELFRRSLFLA